MKTILISGTPGTGKTSISKRFTEITNAEKISLSEIAIKKGFTLKVDEKRETQVIDSEKIIQYVLQMIENAKKKNLDYLIIESHFSDIIPADYADFIIILRAHPSILQKRLKSRGYKEGKIRENIQSEILGNCTNYFIGRSSTSPILEIDTSHHNINKVASIILDIIEKKVDLKDFIVGNIDWLEELSQKDTLFEYFD